MAISEETRSSFCSAGSTGVLRPTTARNIYVRGGCKGLCADLLNPQSAECRAANANLIKIAGAELPLLSPQVVRLVGNIAWVHRSRIPCLVRYHAPASWTQIGADLKLCSQTAGELCAVLVRRQL